MHAHIAVAALARRAASATLLAAPLLVSLGETSPVQLTVSSSVASRCVYVCVCVCVCATPWEDSSHHASACVHVLVRTSHGASHGTTTKNKSAFNMCIIQQVLGICIRILTQLDVAGCQR